MYIQPWFINVFTWIHSFIPLACAECNNSLPFSGASSISLCYIPFPPTSLPSSLTLSCHLFLGLPLSLVISKFIYNKNKYELNCVYCNITLARNRVPWWWSDKIETCWSVLKCFMWNFMCIHWLMNWSDSAKNAWCYNKIHI